MTTTRLTPAERKLDKFTDATVAGHAGRSQEPAMGTLDERLTILCRRLNAPATRVIRLTRAEKAELAQYDESVDTHSSASRQHYIDTGEYLAEAS